MRPSRTRWAALHETPGEKRNEPRDDGAAADDESK
jgi:hypothetical protein